jgi:diketogulonate reductase-like aldo/keto reductase
VLRAIPKSGEEIPVVGLGTWQTFDVDDSERARAPLAATLDRFAAAGGRVIDTSPMYGRAEEVVGALREHVPNAFLATKVWTEGRERGIEQMERSMRRMRADVIDLMQIHNLLDWRTHLRTLRDWKRDGRIRYLGITHYTRASFGDLASIMRSEEIDFVQLPFSLALPDAADHLLPLAADRGIAVVVNRPFEEGALFKRARSIAIPEWTECETWSELALRWIVSHPEVTCVIPATRNPEHVAENMRAGSTRSFDARERKLLRELLSRA